MTDVGVERGDTHCKRRFFNYFTLQAMYIQQNGLGGGMVWALDLDDYKGLFCDAGPWPLMSQVKKYIRESK